MGRVIDVASDYLYPKLANYVFINTGELPSWLRWSLNNHLLNVNLRWIKSIKILLIERVERVHTSILIGSRFQYDLILGEFHRASRHIFGEAMVLVAVLTNLDLVYAVFFMLHILPEAS
jgi:hypothetical protein